MSPKWAKRAHFGDISYNVCNRRKSSYLMLETPYFTVFWRMDNLNEHNHQKLITVVYIRNTYKSCLSCFGVTEFTT